MANYKEQDINKVKDFKNKLNQLEIINDNIKTDTDINNTNDKGHKHIILPLPPYSPELNAIEPSWATIKKMAENSFI